MTDGRFLPTLGFAPGQERESYINPGGVYTFELVLANEGLETDDLSVTAASENDTGWSVAVVPGRAFRVPPGNATRFGVEVTAPKDAAEGDRLGILVEAVSKHDPEAKARARLGVVTAVDVPLEDVRYEEAEDQIAPLEERKRDSPALGWPVAVTAMLAALAWQRPRRPERFLRAPPLAGPAGAA